MYKIKNIDTNQKNENKKIQNIELNILLCTQKKMINKNIKILTPENINSGSSMRKTFINIWRKEEMCKVLIHEFVHFFEIDFIDTTKNYDLIKNKIKELINFEGIDKPYESYTDTLAIIINTIFIHVYTNINLDILYLLELNNCFFQVAKILNFFNIKNIRDIFIKNENNTKIIQSTSVLSYYIIKCAILYSINIFEDFIKDTVLFNDRIKEYIEIIIKALNNEEFLNYINQYINFIINNYEDNYIYNNLRMSILQLK
jgi:hypothetical protein